MGILTCRNESEEENLRPDIIEDSSLKFLPRERTIEEEIAGRHDARVKPLEVLGRGGVKRGARIEVGRTSLLLHLL